MFAAKAYDTLYLDDIQPMLDIYFEDNLENCLEQDNHPSYTKPAIWFESDHTDHYTIGIAFAVADEKLVYVPWNDKKKKFAYEESRYIKNPPAMFMDAQKSGKMITLFGTSFDPDKDMSLGGPVEAEIWQALRDDAEGKSEGDMPRCTFA